MFQPSCRERCNGIIGHVGGHFRRRKIQLLAGNDLLLI